MKIVSEQPHSSTAPAWRIARAIDQGRRDYQEDSLDSWSTADATRIFVVVADGAGGHGGGAEASAAAVAEAGRRLSEVGRIEDAGQFLGEWMLGAHEAVKNTGDGGARTAAVAMLARGGDVDWVHAGDCRLYHFRDGKRLQRTRDDSIVQVLFEQGEISEWEMGRHEDQNRLLQAIGGEATPTPRRGSAGARPGDVFLLCSDGFWENLKPEELAGLTRVPPWRREKALQRAVRLAVRRGGKKADNTSAVLASFGESASAPRVRLPGWVRVIAIAAIVAALILLIASWKGLSPAPGGAFRDDRKPRVADETAPDSPFATDHQSPDIPPKP
jgi:PPM family protein phosphatase